MRGGTAGGIGQRGGVRVLGKPGDVFGDRSVEQHHLLRQIAGQTAQRRGPELVRRGAAQTHGADRSGPKPGQGTGQSGFSRPGRPDHAQRLPGRYGKADSPQHGRSLTGGQDGEVQHLQPGHRARQRGARAFGRVAWQEQRQAAPRLGRARQKRPLRDDLLDRLKRAAQQDRGRHHRPAAEPVVQHKPGPQTQRRRLQHHPQRAAERVEQPAPVAGPDGLIQRGPPQGSPARKGIVLHAQRQHRLCAFGQILGPAVCGQRPGGCPLQQGFAQSLVQQRQADQQRAPCDGQPAERRPEGEKRGQKQRCPRQVESRDHQRRGPQPLHRLKIALRRQRRRIAGQGDQPVLGRAEDALVQPFLQAGADAGQNAAARMVQHAQPGEQARRQT